MKEHWKRLKKLGYFIGPSVEMVVSYTGGKYWEIK